VSSSAQAAAFQRARRKVYRRIIPLVFVSYVIAYIDRSNVALVKLTMEKTFGWTNATFGTGVAFFYLGYFLLEIPGAVIVERWSARKWISRIMVTWGIVAAMQALVTTPGQFYSARLCLGLAEAGFFPGVVVYLTHWFSRQDRARALAFFIMAAPVAQIISPRLSYPLLRLGTTEIIAGQAVTHPLLMGLQGWQWVYIGWGIPAVILGIAILFLMTDRPALARWLTDEEKAALQAELARDRDDEGAQGAVHLPALAVLRDPRVWLLAATNFTIVCAHYGAESFLPSILQRWYGLDLRSMTWLLMLPSLGMLLGQIGVSLNSDRTGERWWHTAVPMFVGAAALVATPFTRGSLPLTLLAFALVFAGIRSYLPPFFALPRLFLSGTAAAGGIGLINAIGNLGGAAGPYVVGWIETASGSFRGGLWFLAFTATVAGTIVVFLRHLHRRNQASLALAVPGRSAPSQVL
jgi:ACS family tartrate transporter-like MFS transporter